MSYWEYLYRPKREGESEQDRLMRRLSFKLPIVFRYSIMFSVLGGVLHALKRGSSSVMRWHCAMAPIYMIGLTH